MSQIYSIDATLKTKYSVENIRALIIHGSKIGFIYSKIDSKIIDPNQYIKLSEDEAVREIFIPDISIIPNTISVQFNDTFFSLHILNNDDKILAMFSSFSYPWHYKENNIETEELDLIRYIQLMLKLIEGYQLINLIVEKR